MNIPEEVGSTARGFIDALKTQPAVLALIVSNFALLVFIFVALKYAAEARSEIIQLLASCGKLGT